MGLMDFLKPADINAGVEEFRATPGARLIDVRTAGEYAGGHIPGAVNLPGVRYLTTEGTLRSPEEIRAAFAEVAGDRPVALYCGSGITAAQAALAADALLVGDGCRVLLVGGIAGVERGADHGVSLSSGGQQASPTG